MTHFAVADGRILVPVQAADGPTLVPVTPAELGKLIPDPALFRAMLTLHEPCSSACEEHGLCLCDRP